MPSLDKLSSEGLLRDLIQLWTCRTGVLRSVDSFGYTVL